MLTSPTGWPRTCPLQELANLSPQGADVLDSTVQDVRFALRTLRRNPAFTFAALLTLALGIGGNAAIYSVIDAVLLHPVPFPGADRLVAIYQKSLHEDRNAVSYPNLLDW